MCLCETRVCTCSRWSCCCVQKANTAVEYMAAHLSKIHGLDWHPDNEFILATSSQDNSVRVRFPGVPERTALEPTMEKQSVTCRTLLQPEEPERSLQRTSLLTRSPLCLVLGLPPAQEVSEHSVLPGSRVEGQVHGEFQRPPTPSCTTRSHGSSS